MAGERIRDIFAGIVNAYPFMTAETVCLQSQPPRKFERAWIGVMVLSLGWGLLACGIWLLCQLLFGLGGHGSLFSVPALVTGVVFCFWPYRRSMISMAETLAPSDASARALVLALLAALVVGIYSAFTGGEANREFDLPSYLQWVRPYERHYRLLLLAPLWGGWAMIIAPKFRRLSPDAGIATAAFANGCGPFRTVLCMLPPLGGTMFYFQYLYWWWQIIIPALTVIAAIASGWFLSRRQGLERPTLLAVNLLTQLVFLMTYLAGLNCGGRPYY